MIFKTLLVVGVLAGIGCSQSNNPENWKSTDIGLIESVKVIPTSFNENIKTEVVTTKTSLVIEGIASGIPFGNEAYLIVYKNGKKKYLAVDGHGTQYTILD